MAEHPLKYPEIYQDAGLVGQVMTWHAIEEVEHKSVAFDVYRDQVDDEPLRKRAMLYAVVMLTYNIFRFQISLLQAQKHFPTWKEWTGAFKYFWGKKGIARICVKSTFKFFRTGFHPTDIDQSDLISDWENKYPEIASLEVK